MLSCCLFFILQTDIILLNVLSGNEAIFNTSKQTKFLVYFIDNVKLLVDYIDKCYVKFYQIYPR